MKTWLWPVVAFLLAIILYLFQLWNYNQILRAIEPWIPLFGPLLAAALVYFGWNRSHTDSSTRDMENWRRTQLTQLIVSFTTSANILRKTIGGSRFLPDADARLDEVIGTKDHATNIAAISMSAKLLASDEYSTLLYDICQFSLELQKIASIDISSDSKIEVITRSFDNAETIFQTGLSLIPLATRAELGLHDGYPNGVSQITMTFGTIVRKFEEKMDLADDLLKNFIKDELNKLPARKEVDTLG